MPNNCKFPTFNREGEFLVAKLSFSCKKLPHGRRSLYFQSSDRTLHHWCLSLPQDLIIVYFPNMLIPMVLFLHSRVKGENVQIFWVTLCLILDNLINKTTPVWNLKNVELSRRKYYGTLDKREKFTILSCVLLFVLECSWLYSCVTFLDLDTTFSDGLYW